VVAALSNGPTLVFLHGYAIVVIEPETIEARGEEAELGDDGDTGRPNTRCAQAKKKGVRVFTIRRRLRAQFLQAHRCSA
jgi:hypothetical protein